MPNPVQGQLQGVSASCHGPSSVARPYGGLVRTNTGLSQSTLGNAENCRGKVCTGNTLANYPELWGAQLLITQWWPSQGLMPYRMAATASTKKFSGAPAYLMGSRCSAPRHKRGPVRRATQRAGATVGSQGTLTAARSAIPLGRRRGMQSTVEPHGFKGRAWKGAQRTSRRLHRETGFKTVYSCGSATRWQGTLGRKRGRRARGQPRTGGGVGTRARAHTHPSGSDSGRQGG